MHVREPIDGPVALLLAASIVFGTAAVADVALVHAAPPHPEDLVSAGAFEGAKFSVVAGSGGVPLNVVEVGDPALPAILLIHGFRQSYLSWTYQFASDLKTRCHIVAFDLRGHGNSGSPWQPDAYGQAEPWADDVNAVIKATGLSKPLLVGWSYGGNVAIDFARYHPEVPLAGYILVATTAGFDKTPPSPANAPVRPTASPNLLLNIAAVDASTGFLFPTTIDAKLRDQFKAAAMRVSPFVDQGIARRAGSDNLDLADSLHAPVTFVFGGRDPIVGPALAQTLASRLPRAKVVVFPNAGHGLFIEDPDTFNALLDGVNRDFDRCSAPNTRKGSPEASIVGEHDIGPGPGPGPGPDEGCDFNGGRRRRKARRSHHHARADRKGLRNPGFPFRNHR
jgi:pimeloyl-ACP methyl ester carboxylesterase